MENKKTRKFNIVDIIVLLVLLLGIAFVLLRIFGGSSLMGLVSGETQDTYVITFTGDEVPEFVAERVVIGSAVTDDACTVDLGTVLDVQLDESISYNANAAGELVASSRDDSRSIKLMCEVQASDNGNGVSVDGTQFGVGHTMVVRAGDAKMYLTLYDIEKKSESEYAEQ